MDAVADIGQSLLNLIALLLPGISADSWFYQLTVCSLLLLVAWLSFHLSRFILEKFKLGFLLRGHLHWQQQLVENKFFRRLSHLLPALIIYLCTPLLINVPSLLLTLLREAALIYLLLAVLFSFSALLNSLEDIYNASKMASRAPITGFVQIAKLAVSLIIGLLIISILLDKSPTILLSGLTAIAAILLLIFRDTLLGFVAGIQIAASRMVNTGDWIEVPKFNADGEVREVGLTIVKVQNWDNTVSTLPTYSLISEAVKNWRGMAESGGRRIKRAIHIDINSCQFCDQTMLDSYNKIKHLQPYLAKKSAELNSFNQQQGLDQEDLVNSRRLTNIGTFRAYVVAYLRHHPQINQQMTLMVRQLPPTETGLPIEIYCFSANKNWLEYEGIQADIFDHIFAMLAEFKLRAYQRISDKP